MSFAKRKIFVKVPSIVKNIRDIGVRNREAFSVFYSLKVIISFFCVASILSGCSIDEGNLSNHTGASAVTYKPFKEGAGVTRESEQWILKALEALTKNQYATASQNVNKALQYDSQNSYLHYLNGLIYHIWGLSKDPSQLVNAAVGYKVALQFDSGNTFAARNLGKLYLDSHQYSRAQSQYASGVLSDPSSTSMLMGLAISSYLNQDVTTALQAVKILEKEGKFSSDTYQIASLVYAAAGDSTTAHAYFQKAKTVITDAHTLRYLEERLKAWNTFYLVVSKKDLEQIATSPSQPGKKSLQNTRVETNQKGLNTKRKEKMPPSSMGASKKKAIKTSKGKKKKSPTTNENEMNLSYLPYLEQGAADEGDESDSEGAFGSSEGEGSFSGNAGGGFGSTSDNSSDDSDGFGDNSDDSDDDSDGFGEGTDSAEGFGGESAGAEGGFGGSSYGFPDSEESSPYSNKMVVIDVAIIRTEQIENTSRGNNLLEALGNLTQNGSNPLAAYGFNIASPSTRGRTVAYSLSIPQLKYSLNIANDQNSYNDILATPTLIATHGKPSAFFSGTDVSLALTGTQGGGNLVTKEVGINLSVTPQFLSDGRISLNITAGRTIFTEDPLPGYTANTQLSVPVMQTIKSSVKATAALSPGESLLLSGLTEKYYLKTDDKVPGLGDAPFIGYAFGNASSQRIERSILFVLTPHFAEKLAKDGNGNYVPLLSEEDKQKDKQPVTELKESYPTLFQDDPTKAFLTKLQDPDYSRHFRPNDMPTMNTQIIPDFSSLLSEVTPYLTRVN